MVNQKSRVAYFENLSAQGTGAPQQFAAARPRQQRDRSSCRVSLAVYGLTGEVLSSAGKLSGTGMVTLPVAAHSVPRCSVV